MHRCRESESPWSWCQKTRLRCTSGAAFPPFEIFPHPDWNSSKRRPCRVTEVVIDEVPEPSYKHAAKPNGLGTNREKSDEELDVDVANRFLAQNLRRGQDRFFELIPQKSCRE